MGKEIDSVEEAKANRDELSWDDIGFADVLGFEVGYRLIPLVDKNQGGELLGRLKSIRRKLSQEMGFLIPPFHIRDNMDLMPNTYRISFQELLIAEGEILPENDLAIDPGRVTGKLQGETVFEPAYGLPAVWIKPKQKDDAQNQGYTVVDGSTVIATHVNQVLKSRLAELFRYDDIDQLIKKLAVNEPALSEKITSSFVGRSSLFFVIKHLLLENISLRLFPLVAEVVVCEKTIISDEAYLLEKVRVKLKEHIYSSIFSDSTSFNAYCLKTELEKLLCKITSSNFDNFSISTDLDEGVIFNQIIESVSEVIKSNSKLSEPYVFVVNKKIRLLLSNWLRQLDYKINVLSFDEIPRNKSCQVIGYFDIEGKGAENSAAAIWQVKIDTDTATYFEVKNLKNRLISMLEKLGADSVTVDVEQGSLLLKIKSIFLKENTRDTAVEIIDSAKEYVQRGKTSLEAKYIDKPTLEAEKLRDGIRTEKERELELRERELKIELLEQSVAREKVDIKVKKLELIKEMSSILESAKQLGDSQIKITRLIEEEALLILEEGVPRSVLYRENPHFSTDSCENPSDNLLSDKSYKTSSYLDKEYEQYLKTLYLESTDYNEHKKESGFNTED